MVSDRQLGAQIGNAMSQTVVEMILINLLPAAGLLSDKQWLYGRWRVRNDNYVSRGTDNHTNVCEILPEGTRTSLDVGPEGKDDKVMGSCTQCVNSTQYVQALQAQYTDAEDNNNDDATDTDDDSYEGFPE